MNSFIPPHIWEYMAHSPRPDDRAFARMQLQQDIAFRAFRQPRPPAFTGGPGVLSRLIYDVGHDTRLPGTLVRREGQPDGADRQVNDAYDALGGTWSLYWDIYGRDSIDNNGMGLIGCVHYGQEYENAFWDGYRMVFGDGGYIFNPFTSCPDIISHELTHGVTQMTAGFEFEGERLPFGLRARGIWKPARLGRDGAALSITTASIRRGVTPRYDDQIGSDDEWFEYRYQGTDPTDQSTHLVIPFILSITPIPKPIRA